jgi:hypothetical protein
VTLLLRHKPRTIVRRVIIDRRAFRDDPGRIEPFDRPVARDIVTRLQSRGDTRDAIKLPHIVREAPIICDPLLVTFE